MQLSADFIKLKEALGTELTREEAKAIFKSIAITSMTIWISSDEEQLENNNTNILTDSLALLMYVMI